MNKGLKIFIKKAFKLACPYLIWGLVVIIVDPFSYFNVSGAINADLRREVAERLSQPLWKMIDYSKDQKENILLGTSKMENVDALQVYNASGEKYYNFACGGASLQEMIDIFWHTTKTVKLKKVYMELSFDIYNVYQYHTYISQIQNITANPFLYFVNFTVLQSTIDVLYFQIFHKHLMFPPSVRDENIWETALNVFAPTYYQKYKYPDDYNTELKEIADYCMVNGIKLTFIIFPTHTDLQKRVTDFGLDEYEARFLADTKKIGDVYDFNYPNEFTANKSNFVDPFHVKPEILITVIDEVWRNNLKYARVSKIHK